MSSACAGLSLCVACGGRSALDGRAGDSARGSGGAVASFGGAPGSAGAGGGPARIGSSGAASAGAPASAGQSGSAQGGSAQGGAGPVLTAPDPRRTPPVFCSSDGWCGSHANFVSIWGSSAFDIWIVANQTGNIAGGEQPSASDAGSALLHWDGVGWKATQFDGTRALRAVWGTSKEDVWVVGAGETLQHFDGKRWSPIQLMVGGTEFSSVFGTSARDVWVVGANKFVVHFDGASWTRMEVTSTWDVFRSGWGSADEVWVLGDTTLNHFDLGSWSSLPRPANSVPSSVWGRANHEAWIAGQAGTIERWSSTGKQGANDVPGQPAAANFRNVWGRSDNDAWAVGEKGRIARWSDAGWSDGPQLTESNLNAVWGDGDSTWFVGDEGTFLKFDGQGWSANPRAAQQLKRLWGTSARDVWAAGRELMHWDGDSWQVVDRPGSDEVLGLWGSNAADIWAAGASGLLLHWDGAGWQLKQSPSSVDITGIWGSANDDIWAVDGLGHFLHFNGISWWLESAQNFGPLTSVWGRNASDIIAVSGSSRIRFDGHDWSLLPHHPNETPSYKIAFGNASLVWLGGNVPWSAYKAGGARPELGRWDGGTLVDNLEPTMAPQPIVITASSVEAGWADTANDVWIALPRLMHWDGAQWTYSATGGSSPVAALWGTTSDLWALTANGQIINKSR